MSHSSSSWQLHFPTHIIHQRLQSKSLFLTSLLPPRVLRNKCLTSLCNSNCQNFKRKRTKSWKIMLELQRSLEILKIEFCMDLLRMKTLHRFLKTMSLLTFLQSQRRLQNRFLLDLRSLKLLRRKSILQEKVSDLWHIEHLCCSSVL